ncbi:PDZ domain-containing protein [Lutibacter sp. B1]|uniref:PDZ domain-containing protein n=1 Tax=Lutibacter sp. B1 TaxID=2725996 RepID=UPI0014577653|nr:PDZ domain-containing protein [Lutibacter sp. B1]NLP56960.1 PDZ domain-containing protein [Lutibacter sp. B1]
MHNLIVFPIEVNGKELNFILDSGVGVTVLFNLNPNDSIPLKNIKKIKLQGLGSEEPVDAIFSDNNFFKFNKIAGFNQKLYVIFDDSFDLSSKLGITIHGIIGYEILKDFVVNINYTSKRITFYNPEYYKYKDCSKCEVLKIEFNRLKPYVDVGVKLDQTSNEITTVKLLIDSGGSDAMWLFENSHPDILPPTKFFHDYLGEGLSGSIYGKRSFIEALYIGKYELIRPTISYPDSISTAFARRFEERNGSIGANILKRFNVTFDYNNNKIFLKKGRGFKDPFRYNMSGIELAYNGKILVEEEDKTSFSLGDDQGNSQQKKIILDYNYKYTFKPSYIIQNLRVGSPAYNAGLQKGDIVIKIDGKYTYDMKLEDIVEKFYQKENKKVTLVVERYGQDYEYHFKLKDMLK